MHTPVFPRATSSGSFSRLFFVARVSSCSMALDQLATSMYFQLPISLLSPSNTSIFLPVSLPLRFPALPFIPKSQFAFPPSHCCPVQAFKTACVFAHLLGTLHGWCWTPVPGSLLLSLLQGWQGELRVVPTCISHLAPGMAQPGAAAAEHSPQFLSLLQAHCCWAFRGCKVAVQQLGYSGMCKLVIFGWFLAAHCSLLKRKKKVEMLHVLKMCCCFLRSCGTLGCVSTLSC